MSNGVGERHLFLTEYSQRVHGRLISCSQPAPEIDPLAFLRQAHGNERFFWRDGRQALTLVGSGVAANLMGWGESRFVAVQRQARELFDHARLFSAPTSSAAARETENGDVPSSAAGTTPAPPRLFGGFSFRDDFVPDNAWAGFHPAHFVLPHLQLVQSPEGSWLTINALLPPGEDSDADVAETVPQLQAALAAWVDQLSTPQPVATPVEPTHADEPAGDEWEIRFPMSYNAWKGIIEQAIDRFATTELDKVVLARVCEARRQETVQLDDALAKLIDQYPECLCFLFEPRPHHAFFGATPEMLVALQGRAFTSMGLAGSIQRGATTAEDEAFGTALLNSAKDRHEHALVVQAMERRLAPLCRELEIPAEPQLYQLRNIQHLFTPVRGTLSQADGILPLVEALHPTPALGGTPRAAALEFIREAEPVPRGWYAAPVGWIDHRMDGAFGVAIRSAVAQDRRVWLYAGAGIVADSVPQNEWEETGWKFRPIQDALGIPR